eukprot:403347552
MGNKQDKCVATGISSGIIGGAGLGIMVVGGPIGIVVGGAVMSMGIGGTVNSVSQAKNDKEDFSFGEFAGHSLVNGVVGAATGGLGVGFQGAKVGVQVAVSAGGGSVLGGCSKITTNLIEKKKFHDGLLTAVVCGGVAGGAGASIGSGVSKGGEVLTQAIAKKTTIALQPATNVAIKSASGFATGAITSGVVTVASNAINIGEISIQELCDFLGNPDNFQDFLDYCQSQDVVNDQVITLKKRVIKNLPSKLENLKAKLLDLRKQLYSAKSIFKGTGNSILTGGIIGGVTAAAISTKQECLNKQKTTPMNVENYKNGPSQMPASGQIPDNLTPDLNKKELTTLYNSDVKSITPIERPMDIEVKGFKVEIPVFKHKATLIELQNGEYYCIEKGGSYAPRGSNKGIIKNANNLGSKMRWRQGETQVVQKGTTVGQLVDAANFTGKEYCLLTDNCYDSQHRVLERAGYKQPDIKLQDSYITRQDFIQSTDLGQRNKKKNLSNNTQ